MSLLTANKTSIDITKTVELTL